MLDRLKWKQDSESHKKYMSYLRKRLLDTQFELIDGQNPAVLIIIAGLDKTGKAEAINHLNKWLDVHHVRTIAAPPVYSHKRDRKLPLQKFWKCLPPAGDIGIYYGGWYEELLEGLAGTKKKKRKRAIRDIRNFERYLTNEGILILKFWFQLDYDELKKRRRLHERDPQRFWRLDESLPVKRKHYEDEQKQAAQLLTQTDDEYAHWHIVEDSDPDFRRLLMVETIQQQMAAHLLKNSGENKNPPEEGVYLSPEEDRNSRISMLDLRRAIDDKEYKHLLHTYQRRLHELTAPENLKNRSVVAIFEGNDAAGKGGAIRRLAASMESSQCRVIPIAAPTKHDLKFPYLWRFWQNIPLPGQVCIFDRSWYGRVLVERVEQLCSQSDLARAYAEINEFEKQLSRAGVLVIKFWLAIDQDEQLKRFEDRENESHKRYKLTEEDWRNRDKWDQYVDAAEVMFANTDTKRAPWHLVEGNDKQYARVKILQLLCHSLEEIVHEG